MIKFALTPALSEASTVSSTVETGQNSSEAPRHSVNPNLLLKMLQMLQTKGTLTTRDVKLLSRQHASMQTEEKLAKVGREETIQVMHQCE